MNTRSRFRVAMALAPLAGLVAAANVSAVTINVARVGTATQSSTRTGSATQGDIAQVALDGITNGSFNSGSVTHTNGGVDDFWQTNLNADRAIQNIVLFNRGDCCGTRLSNFTLSVLDSSNAVVFSQFVDAAIAQGGSQSFNVGGIVGKTVKVQLNGLNDAGDRVLSLAEVQVFADVADNDPFFFAQGRNLARLGSATQSTTRTGAEGAGGGNKAILAIDGNTSGVFADMTTGGSISHTLNESTPSWTVDLKGPFKIENVIINERTDAGNENLLNNFTVSFLDAGMNVVHSQVVANVETAKHVVAPYGTEAQFVRVQMNNTGSARSLQLAEVQVLGGEMLNIARNPNAVATQSSVSSGGLPGRAIDGITNGIYQGFGTDSSVTHTGSEANPWWNVDFGGAYNVEEIVLYNRTDCCSDRLAGAEVRLFDDTGNELFLATIGATTGIPSFRIDAGVMRASSLEVRLPGSSRVLSLAEVQVFGTAFVPEPATFALLGLGAAGLLRRRHRIS